LTLKVTMGTSERMPMVSMVGSSVVVATAKVSMVANAMAPNTWPLPP